MVGDQADERGPDRRADNGQATSGEILRNSIFPCLINGIVAPTAINVSPNILVATATFGSMPNWNITGTVISELLPVTTPTTRG